MGKILLRGGCILTLGVRTQNLPRGDVLIEDDRIVEVGIGLRARDAEQVDASDTIVMPGFVDTHRHVWTSLFRNLGDRGSARGTPAATWEIAAHFGPDDVYAATLVGLLGAAEGGITTVVDWSHLPLDDGLADAALQAHADSGLRTVFAHAPTARDGDQHAPPLADLLPRLTAAAGPRTVVAAGSTSRRRDELDATAEAWTAARSLGLRIHHHAGGDGSHPGAPARLHERDLLGGDVTLVHPRTTDPSDLDAIAASGTCISLAPASEMATGLGAPPIQELIDRDLAPGLAVDDERVAPGDLFAQMRATISVQHATVFDRKLAGKAALPKLMTTRDVIRFATRDGARAAGLQGSVGSIEPGMQADLIVLRTDRPNIFPINDPIGAVVWGMDTSNVDQVFVAGSPVMRDGALTANVEDARDRATAAQHRVAVAAGLTAGTAAGGAR
jgi:cytosine/adenosine deaminase-related metal-dependent hydrolase